MEPNQTLDKFVFSSLQQETDNETDLMWVVKHFP